VVRVSVRLFLHGRVYGCDYLLVHVVCSAIIIVFKFRVKLEIQFHAVNICLKLLPNE